MTTIPPEIEVGFREALQEAFARGRAQAAPQPDRSLLRVVKSLAREVRILKSIDPAKLKRDASGQFAETSHAVAAEHDRHMVKVQKMGDAEAAAEHATRATSGAHKRIKESAGRHWAHARDRIRGLLPPGDAERLIELVGDGSIAEAMDDVGEALDDRQAVAEREGTRAERDAAREEVTNRIDRLHRAIEDAVASTGNERAIWRQGKSLKPGAYYTPAGIIDPATGTGAFLADLGRDEPDFDSRLLLLRKSFDEAKHPRDSAGKWVSKGKIEEAKTDPAKRAALERQVTDPAEKAKLAAALDEPAEHPAKDFHEKYGKADADARQKLLAEGAQGHHGEHVQGKVREAISEHNAAKGAPFSDELHERVMGKVEPPAIKLGKVEGGKDHGRTKIEDLPTVAESRGAGTLVLAGKSADDFAAEHLTTPTDPETVKAIDVFKQSSALNRYNRAGDTHRPDLDKYTEAIDSAIAESKPLSAPLSVFRTVDVGDFQNGLKEGETFTDGAHLSTSLDADWAATAGVDHSENTMMQIRVPAGTKGVYTGGINKDYEHEKELILPRGGTYRVAKVEPMGKGKYVTADYVPAKADYSIPAEIPEQPDDSTLDFAMDAPASEYVDPRLDIPVVNRQTQDEREAADLRGHALHAQASAALRDREADRYGAPGHVIPTVAEDAQRLEGLRKRAAEALARATPPEGHSQERTVALARGLAGKAGEKRAEHLAKLQHALAHHSHAELAAIKESLGIRASGTKAEVAAKLAERAGKTDRSNRQHFSGPSMTTDEAEAAVRAHDHSAPGATLKLANILSNQLTGKQLVELKQRLGIKASGAKWEMAHKLAKRAGEKKAEPVEVPNAEPNITRNGHELKKNSADKWAWFKDGQQVTGAFRDYAGGVDAYDSHRLPKEAPTPAAVSIADHPQFERLKRTYGHLSPAEIENKIGQMDGELADLHHAAKREFNGNGGRRSGAAMSAQAARELGEEKMLLRAYGEHKKQAPSDSPTSPTSHPHDARIAELKAKLDAHESARKAAAEAGDPLPPTPTHRDHLGRVVNPDVEELKRLEVAKARDLSPRPSMHHEGGVWTNPVPLPGKPVWHVKVPHHDARPGDSVAVKSRAGKVKTVRLGNDVLPHENGTHSIGSVAD